MAMIGRRRVIKGMAAGATTLGSGALSPHRVFADSRERFNIVLLVADDMRWNAFGAAPNAAVVTPVIDKLATQGVTFQNNFVTTSICPTSRASILTGNYASRHGVWGFANGLSDAVLRSSLPVRLGKGGYQTGFVGKWGIAGTHPNVFDYWNGFSETDFYHLAQVNGEPLHMSDYLAKASVEFLERMDTDRPFFLMSSFKAPHSTNGYGDDYQPHRDDVKAYAARPVAMPPTATGAAYDRLPPLLKNSLGRDRWRKRFGTPDRAQESMRSYYGLISGLDRAVGEILARLESMNLAQNTLVMFTSDNGMALGDRGLAGKWHMFEESIRTPLIVRLPTAFAAGPLRVINDLTLNVDLMPQFWISPDNCKNLRETGIPCCRYFAVRTPGGASRFYTNI